MLGSPVRHSLSPRMHTAGYAALGLTGWSFTAHEVTQDDLAAFVAGLDENWRGLSLTMPLKEVAFEEASTVSDTARQAAAINTLVRRSDGSWAGENTDVAGIVRALTGVVHDGTATILGSGATARSSVVALGLLGVQSVHVAARRQEAREDLLAWAGDLPGDLSITTSDLTSWTSTPTRLVVSALAPSGGDAAAEQLRAAASVDGWAGGTLFDVVYANWPTPLARAAQQAGMGTISGVEMLIGQALGQFELFTGQPAPVAAMRAAVT